MGPAARLHIDWTRCDGRGLCAELLPEALTRDDWGYPLAAPGRVRSGADKSNVPVTGAELAAAMDAVKLCPLLALRITRP
ncbi:ferredoxin [Arthrobacter livingstonensis]|uniref:Ferredoxin n=1 Tax=Arthrobacter livingstonensis TaxID=670078 RepID=A0A2V5LGM0_9MICC|nr:ferredoxin [Arthrobacter livingstonensis]